MIRQMFFTVIFLGSVSVLTHADLQPIDDDALSDMTGQSAIRIDEIPLDLNNLTGIRSDGSDRSQSFTRITIGADIDLNTSIDSTVIGRRPRPASEVENPSLAADMILNNFTLGQVIDRTDDGINNPTMENFSLRDPYIEIARNSLNELTGVRIGFKEASGVVGHDVVAISGDITAEAEVVGIIGIPIGLTEYPYNNVTRTDRISTEIGLLDFLGDINPTLILNLKDVKQSELVGTQNLYLGFQSEDINYPKVGAGPQGTAHAGYWLNLQDNYYGRNLNLSLDGLEITSQSPRINNSFTPYF